MHLGVLGTILEYPGTYTRFSGKHPTLPERGWPKSDPSTTLPNTDEKKHEAYLKYTQNDVVRTTEIMDVSTEYRILVDYNHWACDAFDHAVLEGQEEVKAFLNALLREVIIDFLDVSEEWRGTGVWSESRREDGTWEISSYADKEKVEQAGRAQTPSRTTPPETEVSENSRASPDEQSCASPPTNTVHSTPLPKHEAFSSLDCGMKWSPTGMMLIMSMAILTLSTREWMMGHGRS